MEEDQTGYFNVMHHLQLVAFEFRKIHQSKIAKWNGRYSANTILLFNSWSKEVEMCVKECKLTNLEAVQLIKDYTSDTARGAVEFYLESKSNLEI